MEVLDADKMRRADAAAIEGMDIPGLVLMENAGRLVAEVLVEELDPFEGEHVVVLAGAGNNGGDGFVAARHLARMGVDTAVYLVGATRAKLRGDAKAMAEAWVGMGGALTELKDRKSWREHGPHLGAGTIVVDALFGTGLSRPIQGLPAEVVEELNQSPCPVVAVDIPSGLFASSPQIPGPVVEAAITVTFARPKPAQVLPPAEDSCGELFVVDIGIPPRGIAAAEPDLHWVTAEEAARLLPERSPEDHKGRFGHVLVVAGSTGKAGAAVLTGWGALRGGAGLATVASPSSARAEVAGFAPELMTLPLPSSREGQLGKQAHKAVLELEGTFNVLALGPGLGQAAATQTEIRRLVQRSRLPVVLDADGVNAFEGRYRGALRKHAAPLIVTPHPGEASRITGLKTAEIQSDRVGAARRIAAEIGGICVLKGYRTIVADAQGRAFINPTGNPGMASGGMGDLLTGLIAAFVAQECEPLEAAILGTYLHGLAADIALDEGETEPTMTAGDVAEALPKAVRALREAEDEADEL
jgi:NAD(P)H-hydrate epimerase